MSDDARLTTVYLPLDSIDRAERNPKDHADEDIDASMDRFGYMEPMLLDDRTGRLVGGHGRLDRLIARRDNDDEPPEWIVVDDDGTWLAPVTRGWESIDDAEALAAGIALNRIGEKGGWKPDELTSILRELADTDQGLDGLGYTDVDLRSLERAASVADTDVRLGDQRFSVIIDCTDERQQAELLERFERDGLSARPLMM